MTVPNGLSEGPTYLDHNATTPVDPAATEAMLPYVTTAFGNPSGDHHYGSDPRAALDRARDQVATACVYGWLPPASGVMLGRWSRNSRRWSRGRSRP